MTGGFDPLLSDAERDANERDAEKKKQFDLMQAQSTDDLRTVVSTVAGRAFMWDLLSLCGLYSDDFRGEDTHTMAYVAGKRAIALKIVENLFTADPHSYTLIRDQAMARRAALEKR